MIEVRWKRPGIEKSWRYGILKDTGKAEEVVISCIKDHGFHVINRRHVQQKVRGPRGGVSWQNL